MFTMPFRSAHRFALSISIRQNVHASKQHVVPHIGQFYCGKRVLNQQLLVLRALNPLMHFWLHPTVHFAEKISVDLCVLVGPQDNRLAAVTPEKPGGKVLVERPVGWEIGA